MISFKNFPLLTKIAIPASFIAVVVLVVAAMAISSLYRIGDVTGEALSGPLRKLTLAREAAYRFNSLTTDDRDYLLAKTEAARAKPQQQFTEDLAAVRKSLEDLYALQTAPERRAVTDRAGANIKAFVALEERAFALVRDGKGDEAYAIMSGDADKLFTESAKVLSDMVASYRDDMVAARAEIAGTVSAGVWQVSLTVGIGFVLGFGALGWIARNQVSRPIGDVTEVLKKLADGDLAVTVLGTDRRDEVGSLAQAAATLKDQLAQAEALRNQQAAEQRRREARATAVEGLTSVFDSKVSGMLSMVAGALGELETTAQAMAANSQQTNRQATVVATATEEAATSVQTVASAAEELASSIAEIGRQVEQSSRASHAASEEAGRTNETVRGLAESSARIGEVVKLINDIASQTNLLALNATMSRSIKQVQSSPWREPVSIAA